GSTPSDSISPSFSLPGSTPSDSTPLSLPGSTSSDSISLSLSLSQDVLLPCNFPCIEDVLLKVLTIEWLFQSNDTSHVVYFYDLSTNQTKINPIYQDRMQTFHRQSSCGNASLLFRDVYLNDTGTFTCNVFTHWSRGAGKLQLLVLSGKFLVRQLAFATLVGATVPGLPFL
uniref:Ig-like domain-containing protein n=1 Tax=Erpetoichthys calabaricus TaxID=27687 RepID=A0A8C4TAG7_ERPCA